MNLRDNRGKRHDLAVILVEVMLALLSNRDGNLSSIERYLKNHYERLVEVSGVEKIRPVSRSQLPNILAGVFDALHGKVATLEIITRKDGKYLMGLKENQKQLKKQVFLAMENQSCLMEIKTEEKGHERIESRKYLFFDVLELAKDDRWKSCQIKTAIKIKRERIELKAKKTSLEESYYLSNKVGKYEELAQAVRQHWSVETNNHIRDVSLKEDERRSKKGSYSNRWAV